MNFYELAVEDNEVYSIELLRFSHEEDERLEIRTRLSSEAQSEAVLSVRAEVPVLSENYWDHCLIRRFASRSALEIFYQQAQVNSTIHLRLACQSMALPQ